MRIFYSVEKDLKVRDHNNKLFMPSEEKLRSRLEVDPATVEESHNIRVYDNYKDAVRVALDGQTKESQRQFPIFEWHFYGKPKDIKKDSFTLEDGTVVAAKQIGFDKAVVVSASLKHVNENFFKHAIILPEIISSDESSAHEVLVKIEAPTIKREPTENHSPVKIKKEPKDSSSEVSFAHIFEEQNDAPVEAQNTAPQREQVDVALNADSENIAQNQAVSVEPLVQQEQENSPAAVIPTSRWQNVINRSSSLLNAAASALLRPSTVLGGLAGTTSYLLNATQYLPMIGSFLKETVPAISEEAGTAIAVGLTTLAVVESGHRALSSCRAKPNESTSSDQAQRLDAVIQKLEDNKDASKEVSVNSSANDAVTPLRTSRKSVSASLAKEPRETRKRTKTTRFGTY